MRNSLDCPILLTAEQAISYMDELRKHYNVEWPTEFLDNFGIACWCYPEDKLYYEPMVGRIIQNRHSTMKIFAIIQQNN